jgi:2-succinyl-5-enolpyruvyl-6-hydroxy-3-cyclohexene-1-carboxylate synthase
VPGDHPGAGTSWRSIAARAVAESVGPPAGPVHLNLAFREPLVPTGAPLVDAPGRGDGRPWTSVTRPTRAPDDVTVARVATSVRAEPRGLIVAGWGSDASAGAVERFAAAAGWPLLADPISGLRQGPHAVSTYEALLRSSRFAERHRPVLVLRLGAAPTSKPLTAWLGPDIPQLLVDPDAAWLDPARGVAERLAVDADPLLDALADTLTPPAERRSEWQDAWRATEQAARAALDDLLDGWETLFEGRVARDTVDVLPDGATMVVASSMPVRDVEAFARPRAGVRFLANRGVNGIDGFVSTVLGAAAVSRGPTVALLGDLCLLHDANGLLGAAGRGVDATFVVLDNDGGGIFHFLPVAGETDAFEEHVATPHGLDFEHAAALYGLGYERAADPEGLRSALDAALAAERSTLIVVRTDREANVALHRRVWEAVAAATT